MGTGTDKNACYLRPSSSPPEPRIILPSPPPPPVMALGRWGLGGDQMGEGGASLKGWVPSSERPRELLPPPPPQGDMARSGTQNSPQTPNPPAPWSRTSSLQKCEREPATSEPPSLRYSVTG